MPIWTTLAISAPRSGHASRTAAALRPGSASQPHRPRWLCAIQLSLVSWATFALLGCPAPPPPAKAPTEPDLTVDEPAQCTEGQDESGSCTPEGCLNPPEIEEGSDKPGAEDDIDCSKWDD